MAVVGCRLRQNIAASDGDRRYEMDASSPVNTGSTRAWKKCQACRVQKVKCKPAYRDWPDEKCNRCEKLGLLCGPNISSKESSLVSAARGSGSLEVLPEDDEYDLPSPNSPLLENHFGQLMRQAASPSQQMRLSSQLVTFEESKIMSSASSDPYSMRFLSPTSNSTSEPSKAQSNVTISKTCQIACELRERLCSLDERVGVWTYLRNALKSMELTGYKDQGLFCNVRMLQINVIGGEIKSIMSQIESLGDQAADNGDDFHAETAYKYLIEAGDGLDDPDFICVHPLLTKMSEFYAKNKQPFQAKKILQRLFKETSASPTRHDSRRLLASSYQEMSRQMAELFRSLSLDETTFNTKTPCPVFHCALQDQVPEEVLNIMPESGNAQDILRRQDIHVALEAGPHTLINSIIKYRSDKGLDVDDRDAFGRTPLHLATQLRRCAAFDNLVIAGADRKLRDAKGRTTLEMAARAGSLKMVTALLANGINDDGADVNDGVAYNTSTPLQAAAEEGHGEVVDILLGHGARVSQVRQYDGKTAAQLALERGYGDIADRINRLIPRDTIDPMLFSLGLDDYAHNGAGMDI